MTNIPQFARQRLQAQPVGEHPDAGVLTAFAEHSLGAAERESVLAHLAACAVCREVVALAVPDIAVQEVTPAVHSWFRWPVLRWAALAASAVIVWAAVLVLVPRTSNRDVSAPVVSMQKVPTAPEVNSKNAVTAAKVSPPAANEQDRALPYVASREPASKAPKQLTARDQGLANAADSFHGSGTIGKLQTRNVLETSEIQSKTAPALAPSAAQLAEKKSENLPAQAADVMTGGGAIEAKRESQVTALRTQPQVVGGPMIRKDAALASIAGTITDPTGAVVPNALVKITNAQTNSSTAVHADSAGAYRTPVPPGVYSVEATSPGMQPVLAKDITIDGAVARNFTLNPSAAAENVEVSAQAAPPPPPASAAPVANISAMKAKAITDQPYSALAGAKAGQLPVASQWRIGKDGALEHSGDGTAWQRVDVSPGTTFRVVISADGTVWAGGTEGTLFHGANEGRTWHRVPVGPKNAPVSDVITAISAPNAKSVVVTTSSGEKWSSNDSGRTWKRLNSQQ